MACRGYAVLDIYSWHQILKTNIKKNTLKSVRSSKRVYNERLSENWQYTKTGHK